MAAIELKASKTDLLNMLYDRGYEIVIRVEGNSKHCDFIGRFSKPYLNAACYTMEWSDRELRLDVVMKLFFWTGLKPRIALE